MDIAILASTIPNCRSYDPCFSYELETIIKSGIEDMYVNKNDRFYYLTLMNENYKHPTRPKATTVIYERSLSIFFCDPQIKF